MAVECNAGKVPVCGNDPARIYDPLGALLPVPPESVANGSCDGIAGSCRPRPVCARGGEPVTCVTSETAYCVLGAVQTTAPPAMPAPPPSMDPGPPASGSADAGSNE